MKTVNIEDATKDELIEYLSETIHCEVMKGNNADCDFIRECSDWLDKLTEDIFTFTPEEMSARLETIKARVVK